MYHLKVVFFIVMSLLSSKITAQSSLGIHNSGIYIGEGANLAIFGDINKVSDAPVINKGTLDVNAQKAALTLTNNSASAFAKGSGTVNLITENSISMQGNEWTISNLSIRGTRDVILETDLNISHDLTLLRGKIIGNGNVTSMLSATGNILFYNTEDNSSYICGDLRLWSNYGDTCIYPIGDAAHYHPIEITNFLEGNNWIQISYSPAKIAVSNPGVNFLSENWWTINLDNTHAEGYINTTITPYNLDLASYYGNVYVAPIHAETEGVTDNLPYFFDNEDQTSNKGNSSFTLNEIEHPSYINLADIAALRIIMPNYLRANSETDINFIIPNIDIIGNADIKIFSRLGNVIYESANYQNDFDFTDYPRGTYFYTINFEIRGESHSYQSFIEII